MNTIERVADRINCIGVGPYIDYQLTDALHMAHEGAYGGNQDKMVEVAKTDLARIAKAALEALCDGLEWRDDVLFLNDKCIGEAFRARNMNNEYIGFRFELLGTLHKGPHDSMEDAKAAATQAARNWIMGIEPDGNMG